jgi:RNA polymerase sigma factor (sigma-70 family)
MQTQLSTTSQTPSSSISETEQERIARWFTQRCLRAYPILRPWNEDLLQSFRLTTWLATKKYDPKRGRFLSFVIPRLKSDLIKFRASLWRQEFNIGVEVVEIDTIVACPESPLLESIRSRFSILRNCGPELSVWQNIYINGMTFAEVARKQGISRQRVHQIYNRALARITEVEAAECT